jgi:hypothetical protein
MRTHIYFPRPGDREVILKYIESMMKDDDAATVARFEREKRIGITGVHQQALYLLALRAVMLERFKDSPILFDDNSVIGFR